ncbi:hypothetical protein PAXRUDRAFT_433866 [Paxillus rubicundulus Ve08.2h10]|uniref:Unplaced genomic scaffold scaffold_27, whole genome shotgun sequence n=1 Tax=Paxillus rubicundulus Ve08.2h10 TaxID=930991 RepID=A0A0D0DWM1_9AGAM|nr:hypothetical protein PAXRUDRAFT_433866 [Paxillus rubicundulus Ve08.2h10]
MSMSQHSSVIIILVTFVAFVLIPMVRNSTLSCRASLGVFSVSFRGGLRSRVVPFRVCFSWQFRYFHPSPSWLFRRVSTCSRAQKVRPVLSHSSTKPFSASDPFRANTRLLFLRNTQSRDPSRGQPKSASPCFPPHTESYSQKICVTSTAFRLPFASFTYSKLTSSCLSLPCSSLFLFLLSLACLVTIFANACKQYSQSRVVT